MRGDPMSWLRSELYPTWGVLFGLFSLFGGLLWFYGEYAGFALLGTLLSGLVILSLLKPDWSFILLIGFTLLFDQYQIPGFEPVTHQIGYLNNFKEIHYIPYFHVGMMSPFEVHLGAILFALFLRWMISPHDYRDLKWPKEAWFGILLACWLAVSVLLGLGQQGELMPALWELRALATFFLVLFITPWVFKGQKEIKGLFWVIFIPILIKSIQAIFRFIELGFSTGGYPTLTSHEDAVFINTLFLLCVAYWVYNVQGIQRFILTWTLPILGIGFLLGMRRAAYASLLVSLVGFVFMQPKETLRLVLKRSIPIALLGLVYAGAFWNSNHPIGNPIQSIKSGLFAQQSENTSDPVNFSEEYYSNLYRSIENYNLAETVKSQPLTGVGFGRKYLMPIPLATISFPLRDYIPHNQILWVFAKSGLIGFFLFWLFFISSMGRGVLKLHREENPEHKAWLTLAVLAIVNQLVTSFFDLQLTYTRNMVYLGFLIGFIWHWKESRGDHHE